MGLFVLGHDCGHHSFSKNRTTNLLVGHLCMSPLGNGLANWIITHNHHHAHTQLKGQDVDWSSWLMSEEEFRKSSWKRNFASRLGYKLPFGVFFWIWLNAIRRGLQKSTRAVMFSNVIMWTVMFGLYGALWYFTGPWGMMKYHGIPAFIAMVTGYYLLTIQHANNDSKWFTPQSWTPVRGQLEATFDVRFTRFLEWLWLDINIHTPHHVSPGIPWYHLRSASLSLKENFPELYQERRFTWNEVSWMVKSPKIRYLPEQDVFVMGSSSVK